MVPDNLKSHYRGDRENNIHVFNENVDLNTMQQIPIELQFDFERSLVPV